MDNKYLTKAGTLRAGVRREFQNLANAAINSKEYTYPSDVGGVGLVHDLIPGDYIVWIKSQFTGGRSHRYMGFGFESGEVIKDEYDHNAHFVTIFTDDGQTIRRASHTVFKYACYLVWRDPVVEQRFFDELRGWVLSHHPADKSYGAKAYRLSRMRKSRGLESEKGAKNEASNEKCR